MSVTDILSLIGGLAFFLFGMHTMSAGLERMSGGMLERTLQKSTESRFKALLLGALVTVLVQSSSATTVMTVGFVNSSLMTLSEAIGVIMGANIGTTFTAWILSLTGIGGDSLLLTLLKPTSFSPLLAAVGAFLLLFSKREKQKHIGSILCGFAVLMFGMNLMSASVAPLSELPEFARIMVLFENPILGVLVGAVITGVIQSSAASVGMLQALSVTGSITYGNAIPIIMGQNIGTCVTALLSCIGATKNAKRTAMVHLYFNLIGSVVFLILFYVVNAFVGFPFLTIPIEPAHIAMIHTVFNIAATLLWLPFADVLEWLAVVTVPDRDSRTSTDGLPLDDRFLAIPSFALEQCRSVIADMTKLTHETIETALSTLDQYDEKKIGFVVESEEAIDRYEDKLGTYLVKLGTKKLLPEDSREIGMFLHTIGDLERIGDHAVNITETATELHQKNISFSAAAENEVRVFRSALTEILALTCDSFLTENLSVAYEVEPLEDVIDALQSEIRARHVNRMLSGDCTMEHGFILNDLLTNMERIGDHCSNIAATLIQTKHNSFDMHSYLTSVKGGSGKDADAQFTTHVDAFSKRFKLPDPAQFETKEQK